MTGRISRVVLVVGAVCLTGAMRAQDAGQALAKKQMMPKDADPDWEVATVRPSDPNDKRDRIDVRGRRIIIENKTVESMLMVGYSVQTSQIANAPDWVKTEHFDVEGTADVEGEPTLEQLQSLLRKVLLERFGLKVHREKRELPVFALRVAKGGEKLTKNTSDPNGHLREGGSDANGRVVKTFTNTSMGDFALVLLFYADKPVVDQTALEGRYDFRLQWTPDEAQAPAPDAPPGLFTAIQEQLGLKLEPVRAPVDVVVVDAVEKPGEN